MTHILSKARGRPSGTERTDEGAHVREWNDEEGWGVIDSPQTPGGCWAHFSSLRMDGYRTLAPGQRVLLVWEAGWQDGFQFRAVEVVPQ